MIFDATLLGHLFYAKLLKPDTDGMKKEKHQRNIHQQLEENPYDTYDDSEGMMIFMNNGIWNSSISNGFTYR